MALRIVDLSHTLTTTGPMSVWPGHPTYSSYRTESMPEKGCNVSALSLGSHTGTHIDAPSHFIADGKTVDELDLHRLFGRAVVVDVRGKGPREMITWEDVVGYEGQLGEGVIVLLCTGWSRYWGTEEYQNHPYLHPDTARKLVERGVRVIGVDALSPDEMKLEESEDTGVHGVILGAGGVIAENLRGIEQLFGMQRPVVSLLPLKIGGCDGSPVRAIAFEVAA